MAFDLHMVLMKSSQRLLAVVDNLPFFKSDTSRDCLVGVLVFIIYFVYFVHHYYYH